MDFKNSIGPLAFLDKSRATNMSIDPIKLNYKWKELKPKDREHTDYLPQSQACPIR